MNNEKIQAIGENSSTCANHNHESRLGARVTIAAEALAGLINDSAEFQNYLCHAQALRADTEAQNLLRQLNGYAPEDGSWRSATELQAHLDALPVMQAFRRAETSLFTLIQQVEGTISQSAGFAFADHARSAACG